MNRRKFSALLLMAFVFCTIVHKQPVKSMNEKQTALARQRALRAAQEFELESILLPGAFNQNGIVYGGEVRPNGIELTLDNIEPLSKQSYQKLLTEENGTLFAVIESQNPQDNTIHYTVYDSIFMLTNDGKLPTHDPHTKFPVRAIRYYVEAPQTKVLNEIPENLVAIASRAIIADAHAQYALAEQTQDRATKKAWYSAAAKHNHLPSLLKIGMYYQEEKYPFIAKEYYEKAANLGSPVAAFMLGQLYEDGLLSYGVGKHPDTQKALEWYRTTLGLNNGSYPMVNQRLFMTGDLNSLLQHQRYSAAQALSEYIIAHSPGSLTKDAFYTLGILNMLGKGEFQKNLEAAEAWIMKAQREGHPEAANTLIRIRALQKNLATLSKCEEIESNYSKKAENGDAQAAFLLGKHYEIDIILCDRNKTPDIAQALMWYKKALSLNPNSYVYYAGKNLSTAEQLSNLIAEKLYGAARVLSEHIVDRANDKEGYYALGILSIQGKGGIEKSFDAARHYMTKAQELGHPRAAEGIQAVSTLQKNEKHMLTREHAFKLFTERR